MKIYLPISYLEQHTDSKPYINVAMCNENENKTYIFNADNWQEWKFEQLNTP